MAHRALVVILLAGLTMLDTVPAVAGTLAEHSEKRYVFDIPAQPLAPAILTFSRQCGVVVTAPEGLTRGKMTAGVSGSLAPEAALEVLLSGSGLSFQQRGGDSFVIVAPSGSLKRLASASDEPVVVADPAADEPAAGPQEVLVTGTQIVRNGYSAPSPLTVVGPSDIESSSPINLSDYLDRLPALAGSTGPQSLGNSVSDGNGGVAGLNLRSLGANRTLVLLDGMRVGPSSENGASTAGEVDVNEFPDELIKRVDVVTGGASAAYGSDALAGVVNFILDKDFTGLKGSASGGITTYGDDPQYAVSLTGGFAFADGRGHFLISGSDHYTGGILHGSARAWITNNAWDQIATPGYTATNGLPFYTVSQHVGSGLYTPGGLITSGPLRGTDFGAGGVPHAFQYGAVDGGSSYMIGGNYQETYPALTDSGEQYTTSLDDRLSRQNLFTRVSYDITDHVQVFGDLLYSNTDVTSYCCTSDELVTINSGNPFIPASVQGQMTAMNIPSFTLGTLNTAIGAVGPNNRRQKEFYALGASGDVDLVGSNWKWNVYASRSLERIHDEAINSPVTATFAQASDVVVNPATGKPICASTLTHPNDGCVPYNPMGLNVNTPAAIAYALGGTSQLHEDIEQNDFAAVLRGEPFSLWAGPVSLATGVEHRLEAAYGASSPTDLASGFFLGNYHPTVGSYQVTEGFVETVVPLAHDYTWAKELDVNAAVRETGYTVSGNVTTFKVGATYDAPDAVKGLRLRGTFSRDIRAPSLGDLYAGGRVGQGSLFDPFNNTEDPDVLTPTVGNPKLVPEEANQLGLGTIYSPPWFPGWSVSIDYFHISINNVITATSAQNEVDACYAGNQAYCGFIQRNSLGIISLVTAAPANTAFEKESGFDLETSYMKDLADFGKPWSGIVSVRGLATNIGEQNTVDTFGNITRLAGVNGGGVPNWSYNVTAMYDANVYAVALTGRGISAGVRSKFYVQCASACPELAGPYYTINDNQMPGQFIVDFNLTYRLKSARLGSAELFVTVENIANNNPSSFFVGNSNALYDRLGRVFRSGIRFKM